MFTRYKVLHLFVICVVTAINSGGFCEPSSTLPTAKELTIIRAKALQDRFKTYVLKKLEVHSAVQNLRGMCLDFVGSSDGLHRSIFGGGPLIVDLANCGEEGDFMDGRIRGLKILGPKEKRDGLTVEQIDQVVEEVNALFADKKYDSKLQ